MVRAFTSAAVVCALVVASSCLAHDPAGHARHHDDFYKYLKHPETGVSCCNNQDCRPAPHRVTPDGVEFYVGNRWITPPARTLMERSDTDSSHWCGHSESTDTPHTFCAVVPRGGV